MAQELENYQTEYMTLLPTMILETQIKVLIFPGLFLEHQKSIHTRDGVVPAANRVRQVNLTIYLIRPDHGLSSGLGYILINGQKPNCLGLKVQPITNFWPKSYFSPQIFSFVPLLV